MKKITFALLLGAILLVSCSSDEIPETESESMIEGATETTETQETEADVPQPEETALYGTVEELIEADGIISVEQAEYTELKSLDLDTLPEAAQELYRGILEETVTYQVLYTVDECTVSAFISLPLTNSEELPPLIIYNRGGNGNYSANTASGSGSYAYYTGCVIIASNYRETSPGTGKDEFGGADVNDVVFWMDIAPELGFADRERIYMYGDSRGGMQTCLALLHDDKNVIRAAACVSGIYDVANNYYFRDGEDDGMQEMLERRIGGSPEEVPEEYAKRSAVTFAEKLDTPLLLIHSTGDERTDYSEAVAFASELEKYGKKYEFITREDNIHATASSDELKEIVKWLTENAD